MTSPLHLLKLLGICTLASCMTHCATAASPAPEVSPADDPIQDKSLSDFPEFGRKVSEVDIPGLEHILRGRYSFENRDYLRAVEEFRLALIYFRDSPFVYAQLSLALRALGQDEKSLEVLLTGLQHCQGAPRLQLLVGKHYYRKMQFKEARAYLRAAYADSAVKLQAGPLLMSTLFWLRQDEAGLGVLEELKTLREIEPRFLIRVASLLEEHGYTPESWEAYEGLQEISPRTQDAAMGQMRLRLREGDFSGAADALVPLFVLNPHSVRLFSLVSRLLHYAGSSESEAYRREALRQASGKEKGLLQVATDDILSGRFEVGLELLHRLAGRTPASGMARFQIAQIYSRDRRFSECLQMLERAGQQGGAYNLQRGLCLGGMGDVESMLTELMVAYTKGVRLSQVTHGASYWLARRVSYDKAMSRYESFCSELVSEGFFRECILGKVTIADYSGRGEVAISLLEESRELNAGKLEWEMRLADLYCRYGRFQEGISLLETMVQNNPNNVMLLNALGFSLTDARQRLGEAGVWLRRAYRLAPLSGFILDSLGWLSYQEGHHQRALKLLQMAARMSPSDPEITRHLGDVYALLGKRVEALKAYKAALEFFPDKRLTRLLRERLVELES